MSCYFPASLFVDSESWKSDPPTGIELRRQLARHFSEDEFLQALATFSGRPMGSVRWLLSQNAVVPAGVLAAALKLRQRVPVNIPLPKGSAIGELAR